MNIQSTGIYDSIRQYHRKNIYPFHMPGHKNNKNFIPSDLLSFDQTEFDATDNLHQPETYLKNSQSFAATVFGAMQSYFFVNGSSGALIAAILSVCNPKEKILIARNCHRSVYNAVYLGDLTPAYLYPEITPHNLQGGIKPESVEAAIIANMDCRAIVITSPTYEGFCSDLPAIKKIADRYDKILIVDEAHGAHFAFHDAFPTSAVAYADLTIQSLHKTLATLGQSAILHLNSTRVDKHKLEKYISLMQTTSPSYILLSTIDYCIKNIINCKNYFDEFVSSLLKYRSSYERFSHLCLVTPKIKNTCAIHDLDISKLVLIIQDATQTGYALESTFVDQHQIQLELYGKNHLVALTTYCDTDDGFRRLDQALEAIDRTLCNHLQVQRYVTHPAEVVYPPRRIDDLSIIRVPIHECVGAVCACFVTPYPPGIPLLAPGERITKQIINEIVTLKSYGCKFIGITDGLTTIEIIENTVR